MRDKNSVAHYDDTSDMHLLKHAERHVNNTRSASTPGETDASRSADRLNHQEIEAVNEIRAALRRPPLHTTNYTQRTFTDGHKGIYAIIDTITNTLVGGLQVHLNHQSAMRTMHDIANAQTAVNKHPLDMELRLLATISEQHQIQLEADEVILTGDQIAAMIQTPNDKAY